MKTTVSDKTLNDYISRCVRLESELAEARKKINSLGGALDETMSTTHYQGKEIDALKAELAEAKREAERLRENLIFTCELHCHGYEKESHGCTHCSIGSAIVGGSKGARC